MQTAKLSDKKPAGHRSEHKKEWQKPVLFIICRGNENGNVLLTCKQVHKGCTVNAASKQTSL